MQHAHAWQDFGQKVDLTARLREILINYPEGTSILKEIVQNADDAKATTVKFCLDLNSYGTESVLSPQMGQFQGPALLAYNDGVFTEKDFESISRIGDSKKREQIGKTGRFGVGFNAIYHLTDVPSFISGQHLVIFDPHCRHLPAISAANPGKKINFMTHDLNASITDQVAPYHLFGCDVRQHFAGTLFRFPLRTQEQAKKSTISKQVYTPDSISSLFSDLKHEATLVLLFLKCVQSIEVLQLKPGETQPQLLFSCRVANSSPTLILQRSLFLHASAAPAEESVQGTYQLDLLSQDAVLGAEQQNSYLIAQRRGPPPLLEMAKELSHQFQVPLIAWGAVAADITQHSTTTAPTADAATDLDLSAPTSGRAFCFLPLPASTSLPVHINGYFELSSNRRDVWHGSDMAGAGRLRAKWNEALLQLVVATAYLDLLAAAATVLGHGPAYNRLWPSLDVPEPWQGAVRQLYGHLPGKPLLWTAANGGAWVSSSNCLFPDDACLQQQHDGNAVDDASRPSAVSERLDSRHATAAAATTAVAVRSSLEAHSQPGLLSSSNEQLASAAAGGLGPLGQALVLLDVPLIDMPLGVLRMMNKYLPELPQTCSPSAARQAAATHPQRLHLLQRQSQLVPLLTYCMADLDVSAGAVACEALLGLRLLPLQDGSLAAFARHPAVAKTKQPQQQLVFLVSDPLEILLVGTQSSLLLDNTLLGPSATSKLSLLASYSHFNLQQLSVKHLLESFLPRQLPAAWRQEAAVTWVDGVAGGGMTEGELSSGAGATGVTWEWLQGLWQWLSAHRQDIPLLINAQWPLLPVIGGKLVPLKPLPASAVVAPGAENWPEGLAQVLQKLGVCVLDTAGFELPSDVLLQHCVHKPSGPGVAAALCSALGWNDALQQQQQRVTAVRGNVTAAALGLGLDEARLLRHFLLQQHWFTDAAAGSYKQQLLTVAKQLPLYELANTYSGGAQQQQGPIRGMQQAGEPAAAAAAAATVPLEPGCCLVPAGVYPAALDQRFLSVSSNEESAVLVQLLAVQQPTAAQVYREVIIPQLGALSADVRDEAMLRLLQQLPQLQQQDGGFPQLLMQTAFVPNESGNLHQPSQLYDPRVPELVALLDPDNCFPAAAFCSNDLIPNRQAGHGSSSSSTISGSIDTATDTATSIIINHDSSSSSSNGVRESIKSRSVAALNFNSLAALQQLGLRSTADLETLVLAARYVERTAKEGDEEMAVARGKALLSYLDSEAERLVGRHTAITSAAAAAVAAAARRSSSSSSSDPNRRKPQRPGQGLFSAVQSLWGMKPGRNQRQQEQQQSLSDTTDNAAEVALVDEVQIRQQQQVAAAQSIATQWAELSRICWCPILSASPDPTLPWTTAASSNGSSSSGGSNGATASTQLSAKQLSVSRLAAPCTARPSNELWLVSAVMNVVDGDCRSQVLLSGLGWNAALPGAVLASQLTALGSRHKHVHDAAVAQKLARIVPVLYGAFTALPAAELAAAAAVLEGMPTVWVGNGFVAAERVAFKGGLDLAPHLYVLPLELSPFRDLLSVLGAQEAFSAQQYKTLLQDLAKEAAGKPLPPQQLTQALAVSQALADVVGASGGGATAGKQAVQAEDAAAAAGAMHSSKQRGGGAVLVPDSEGVLRSAVELVFDDAPWLDAHTAGLEAELHLVHPRLSAPVAEALGVASRRRLLLAASADCLALGLAGAGGAVEAFGQSEALTTRLRHIIQDYPEGPGVLLELVQNADDAGARKAAFLLDTRQYATNSLLGPGMAHWQGPALLAYNDATFSPGDIAAIARIGQDGKMAQPAAIGRFGLGFNAVYHLTDLPSFVSGQHLVLFDPHAKYLPGASAAQPGLRINLNRGQLLKQFPDAFAPYMHFGCSMEGSYPGTLFRFPLRSQNAAAASDIKSSATSATHALQLLQSLADVLPQALLFLKSLKEISVYVVGDESTSETGAANSAVNSGDVELAAAPRLLFKATLSSLDGSGSLQQPITQFVSSGGGGSGSQQLDGFYRRLAAAQESDLPCSIGRVQLSLAVAKSLQNSLIHQQTGAESDKSDAISGHVAARQRSSSISSSGYAGNGSGTAVDAAVDELHEICREEWLVCNHIGGGAARSLALKAWKEDKIKLLPWVGVAARISAAATENFPSVGSLSCSTATSGRAFCFLPLPATTSLPVHINGYFELSSNRRDVWHGSDMAGAGRLRAQWNEALLSSAVAAAYAALLLEAAHLLGPTKQYWQLFPRGQGTVPEPWIRVVSLLYNRLANQLVLWSPAGHRSWLTPRQVLLPDVKCFVAAAATGDSASTATAVVSSRSVSNSSISVLVSANVRSSDADLDGSINSNGGEHVAAAGLPADDLHFTVAAREAEVSTAAATVSLGYVRQGAAASWLSELLVYCGVPLVLALDEEQQKCLLHWTSGSQQVTPALVRKHLSANGQQLSAAVSRNRHQAMPKGRPAAAAALLEYCLLDLRSAMISDHDDPDITEDRSESPIIDQQQSEPPAAVLAELRHLNGLQLLPLCNGDVAVLMVVPQISSGSLRTPTSAGGSFNHFICADQQEQQLLHSLQHKVLDPAISPELKQQLLQLAAADETNICRVTASSLNMLILPQLLPSDWVQQVQVEWKPSDDSLDNSSSSNGDRDGDTIVQYQLQRQHPSRQFIQLLWKWLADRSDASDIKHWPVMPIAGGKLRSLKQPAQVLKGGDWTEHLTSALLKLGCCLLDSQLLNFPCPALTPFVQQPTAAGLLDALAAALGAAGSSSSSSELTRQLRGSLAGSTAAGGAGIRSLLTAQLAQVNQPWQDMLQQLTPAERHQLRTYLLQGKWFAEDAAQLNQQQLQLLRSLPIYEVYPPLPHETAFATEVPRQQQQQQEANAAACGTYRSLLQKDGRSLLLPPTGVSRNVLGSRFLLTDSQTEEEILINHLGIKRVSLSDFLAQHLAVAPEKLDRRALVETLVYVLRNLKRLVEIEDEQNLPSILRDLHLIPTAAAAAGRGHGQSGSLPVLAPPSSFFDPRISSFRDLLDPNIHFPAAPFNGSSSDAAATSSAAAAAGRLAAAAAAGIGDELLDGLVMCGMKAELDLQVFVAAAESIASYAQDDPIPHTRAHALLRYLDVFAQQKQSITRTAETADEPAAAAAAAWKALQGLAWCPVVVEPPDEGLPWQHAIPAAAAAAASYQLESIAVGTSPQRQQQNAAHAQQQQTVSDAAPDATTAVLRSSPKLAAPAELCWLISAPLRLLAAGTLSDALLQQMGWNEQQVLRPSVAIAQLIELGRMYPAGQVHDPDLCNKLSAAAGRLYSSLSSALHDPEQVQLLEMTLSVMPSVWVGTGFAFPAVAALKASEGSSVSTTAAAAAAAASSILAHSNEAEGKEPEDSNPQQQQQQQQQGLLWVVPDDLQQQYPNALATLNALGVSQQHNLAAYAIALAVLAERAAGHPLESADLSTALHLAEAAAQSLLSGSSSIRQLQQPGVMAAATALQAAAAAAVGSSSVAAAGGVDIMLLPDSECVMAPPNELYFNDAAWLGSEGLRLAHAGINQITAEALGVRSMRYQHEVSEQLTSNLPCPTLQEAAAAAALVIRSSSSPSTATAATKSKLPSTAAATAAAAGTSAATGDDGHCAAESSQPPLAAAAASAADDADITSLTGSDAAAATGPVLTVLLSILAWADQLRSSTYHDQHRLDHDHIGSMSVILDEQQHGTQSLLHPGLARLQGPSLCIVLRGLSLSASQLSQAVTARNAASSSTGSSSGSSSSPVSKSNQGMAATAAAADPVAAVQMGLPGVWAITDVLQAISGGTTSYWDPSGAALAQTASELRTPTSRGRSVQHTQPGITDKFEDQWRVWQTCTAAAAGSSIGHVLDALYLRLPLRLLDGAVHSSGIAAAVRSLLGGNQMQLDIHDVRKQVAAFGPAATKSLLFLGHVYKVTVGHILPGPECQPVRVWQAAVAPGVTGSMPLRTGQLSYQQLVTYLKDKCNNPGSLIARLAAARGAAARGRGSSKADSCMKCWNMQLQTYARPAAMAQMAAGKPAAAAAAAAAAGEQEPMAESSSLQIKTTAAAAAAVVEAGQDPRDPPLPQQQQHSNRSSSTEDDMIKRQYNWQISAVCDLSLQELSFLSAATATAISGQKSPMQLSSSSSSSGSDRTVCVTSAVAVCIREGDRSGDIIPAGGIFCPVAIPQSHSSQLSHQNFLISIHCVPAALLQNHSAAARVEPSQQQQRRQHGINSSTELTAEQQQWQLTAAQQQLQLGLATAWQQLLTTLSNWGVRDGLYTIMPDLAAAAAAAGDAFAAYSFKQMYQTAAGMPIWQLHTGRSVHLLQGAFLPPKQQQQQGDGKLSRTAAAAAGLGDEARDFINKYLPSFNVPWGLVAQLEAANISGLRIVSPSVLRPLLLRMHDTATANAQSPHPLSTLKPTQALQLLEFCCSDLITADATSSSSQEPGSSNRSGDNVEEAAAQSNAAAGAGAAAAAADDTEVPDNVPAGVAAVVSDLFGQRGMATLRSLANQMQHQLVQGADEILNAVMDAMTDPAALQQEQVVDAAANAAGGSSRSSSSTDTTAAAAAAAAVTNASEPEINMNKVNWLRGLPIPTAAGTVLPIGWCRLFVYPEQCTPAPHSLLPSHLQRHFVAPDCVAALSWAFKHPEVRQKLRLEYYGLQRLADHLQDALGSTWQLTQPAAAPAAGSSSSSRAVVTQTHSNAAAAAAAVPWDDGAAGGPYLDWLQRLWCVILHSVAAAPDWQQDTTWGATTAAAASSSGSSSSTGARMAGGIRQAAERARLLGQGLADLITAATEAADDRSATAVEADADELIWTPLADWPLIPLVDGRLLRMKYRKLVLAVLPEYHQQQQQQQEARGSSRPADVLAADQQTVLPTGQPTWASGLSEPWNWLLPAAAASGVPVLDPRFNHIVNATQPATAAAAPAVTAASAHSAPSAVSPPAVAVDSLLGPQPVIGRPPFLGPLVTKLSGCHQDLDCFRNCQAGGDESSGWDESSWSRLFDLLADHPPRDLQPESIRFLRELPMYRRLLPQQQQQQQVAAIEGDSSALSSGVASGDNASSSLPRLVALGDDEGWVLTPQAILLECTDLLQMPSLPLQATSHILEHRPTWGELYSILGLTPANLAEFLSSLLLPHLLLLSKADRMTSLNFIRSHWSSGSWALGQNAEFVAALGDIAFVPAAQPAAAAAAAAATARAAAGAGAAGSSDGGGNMERLYLAKQLFDPSVPLFAKVMATMGESVLSSAASSSSVSPVAGSTSSTSGTATRTDNSSSSSVPAVMFPAAPFDGPNWLQILRALGLQSKVTQETFLQLAQNIASKVAALAAATSSSSDEQQYHDFSAADPVALGPLVAAADALLSHLKIHWTGLRAGREFWQALGKITFVPATLGLPGGKYSCQVFTSCRNVALSKDWHLIWSVVPILSDSRTLAGVLAQQIGIRSPPPIAAVLQHLHAVGVDGGEYLMSSWPDDLDPITDVTLKILTHLDHEGLSQQQAADLSGAAFIPVAHASLLVPPYQLYVRLSGAALAPFAWEVPGALVGKLQLLRQIGVKDEPRAQDLVEALRRFAAALAGRHMNPNELSACLRLLAYLCSRSSPGDAAYLADARRSGSTLLVPTAGGLLMPAGRVVAVGGAGGGAAAARLLGRADPQHLILAHPQLSEHICRWLGVSTFSDVITEQLDPSLTLTPISAINNISLQHIQQLISSPQFAASVFSIAAAHTTAVHDLRGLSFSAVSDVCSSVARGRLVFVEKLQSKVVLRSNGTDVTRDSASRQVYEYYDSSTGTMYVAEPPPGLSLSSLLAKVFSRAIGSPLVLPLHPLLDVDTPQQLESLQAVLLPGGFDSELQSALASGQVGCPVQPSDKALLRLRPLRPYTAGELVAVKRRTATSADTGAVLPSSSSSSSNGAASSSVGDSSVQLCYARIAVDAGPAPGQAAYRLSVEVQPGVYETLLSTQVFCFQSGASGPSPTVVAAPAASQHPTATETDSAIDKAGASAARNTSAASSGAADGNQMSASEMATAVCDMLTAAGLPLELDRQELLQRVLAADQQLQSASAAVAELRQEVTRKESEVEALKSSWQCRVCFSRDVNQAFIGCGHMYCSACMPSLAKCPVCRKSSQKIKLYR